MGKRYVKVHVKYQVIMSSNTWDIDKVSFLIDHTTYICLQCLSQVILCGVEEPMPKVSGHFFYSTQNDLEQTLVQSLELTFTIVYLAP